MQPKSPREKFVVGAPDECWPWLGTVRTSGHGGWSGLPAHRVVYELLVGPIADGLTIDHLCRNRICVNPSHLEPVTMRENIMRGYGVGAVAARRDRCASGHPYTETTARIRNGVRHCRVCVRGYARRYRERSALAGLS